jgi:hypothetical protein
MTEKGRTHPARFTPFDEGKAIGSATDPSSLQGLIRQE